MSAPPPPRAKVVSLCGKEIASAEAELHPLAQERERVREALTHWATHARCFVGVVISDEGRVTLVSSMDSNTAAYALLAEALHQARPLAYMDVEDTYGGGTSGGDEDEDDDGDDDGAA